MNAVQSFLGLVLVVLAGAAVLLAIVILVLYEALWVIRLGNRLYRAAGSPDGPFAGACPESTRIGGE